MVYFNSKPQFVRVSAILKEEMTTLWWIVHEVVDYYAATSRPVRLNHKGP